MEVVTLTFPQMKSSSEINVKINVCSETGLTDLEVQELNGLLKTLQAVYHKPISDHEETAKMSICNEEISYFITPYSGYEKKCITAETLLKALREIAKQQNQATRSPVLVRPAESSSNSAPTNKSTPPSFGKS